MKKVTAFIGGRRNGATHKAVRTFEERLKARGEIGFAYVFLGDYRLDFCKGCKLCFDKGEEYCPVKDGRDALIEKMEKSDGVVFASPNYAFHVTAAMKNLMDRTAYILHRPRFFGKACAAIVTQGIYGGGRIAKYLVDAGKNMGFHGAKGCVLKTLEPVTEKAEKANAQAIDKTAGRFYRELMRPAPPPSLFRLMLFRMSRTNIRMVLDDKYRDYRYYREKGWFTSAYYDRMSLGFVKRLAGRFFDFVGSRMAVQR